MSYYNTKSRAENWLFPPFDKETIKEVKEMLESDPDELNESFYKDLEFGTGGMRGIMGVGTNKINKYTLGKNTQGLSNYLKRIFRGQEPKVVIAYDCRNNSRELAQVVADVLHVQHQSPQLLLVQDGVCTYDASHMSIGVDALKKKVAA